MGVQTLVPRYVLIFGDIVLWGTYYFDLKKIVSKNDNSINAKDTPPHDGNRSYIDKIDIRVYSLNTCIY